MKFADFIRVQAIKADLAAEDKEGAIHELVTGLVEFEGYFRGRAREHYQSDHETGGAGKHGHWPRSGGAAHEASQC